MKARYTAGWLVLTGLIAGFSHPEPADLVRAPLLAGAAIIAFMVVFVAINYERAYVGFAVIPGALKRHVTPREVWGMGISYLTLVVVQLGRISDRWHMAIDPRIYAPTAFSLLLALYWLWPLVKRGEPD